MKNIILSAAFMAAFFVSGCAGVNAVDSVIDRGKDKALDALELIVDRANSGYDKLVLEQEESGKRLQRLGDALGRFK
ncbi:MAG: hypothetical protein V7727_18510 [Sneathiella sp.]